jgi:hypothetical protein
LRVLIRVLSDKVKKDWSCYDLIWNSIKLGTENREFSEFFGLWGFKFSSLYCSLFGVEFFSVDRCYGFVYQKQTDIVF